MIQIGFRLAGMNTEGHDTVFAIAKTKEDAFQQIKKKRPYTDHIDTCLEIHRVEDFEVRVREHATNETLKLWFVNLGGYREGQYGEVHKCILVTAEDLQTAKMKAKQDPFFTEPGMVQDPVAAPHIDDKHALEDGVDDVICINEELDEWGIELIENKQAPSNRLAIAYVPL